MIRTLGLQNSKVLQIAKILIKHCELPLPRPDPLSDRFAADIHCSKESILGCTDVKMFILRV